ncbi:polyketide cyclase [Synechococcales cyanobacterium C]|uniref:Polyketide cyclase n=1 Tax=Petrachloros mirabilis ULC683 TaxID=2781853 RepID=A0A8K2A6U5_9CYAN|nr:SRPBCC family protein [Petrachloros mirabilis]NCJ05420.1 polyketide cyclase [Petrachloros mirabilis ULC683]
MADYQFVTHWQIAAPIQTVWDAIQDTEAWPRWWPAIASVEPLEAGDPNGLGAVQRLIWKTPLSYTLTFETRIVQIQAPERMEAIACGDVEGKGVWQLSPLPEGTAVTYTWTVRTTRFWMNGLAAIARPLLEWNHNIIMRQGGQGLAAYLNTDLLAMDSIATSAQKSSQYIP